MLFSNSIVLALSAVGLVNGSNTRSNRVGKRDAASVAAALSGASILNNAVAYGVCSIGYQAFAAVSLISGGTGPVYVPSASCIALGFIVPGSVSTTSTSVSFSSTVFATSTTTASSTPSASSRPLFGATSSPDRCASACNRGTGKFAKLSCDACRGNILDKLPPGILGP